MAPSPTHLLTCGHGLCITNHQSPYLTYIYHIPAPIFFGQEWQRAVQSGFQAEALSPLLSMEGVQYLIFEMETRNDVEGGSRVQSSSSFSLLGRQPDHLCDLMSENLGFIAKLNTPLYITQAVGRRLDEILLNRRTVPQVESESMAIGGMSRPTFVSLLLPAIQQNSTYELFIGDPGYFRARLSTFQPSLGFSVERIKFRTGDQLFAIIETLRMQCLLNEVLENCFSDVSKKVEPDDETEIQLDGLFSGNVFRVSFLSTFG